MSHPKGIMAHPDYNDCNMKKREPEEILDKFDAKKMKDKNKKGMINFLIEETLEKEYAILKVAEGMQELGAKNANVITVKATEFERHYFSWFCEKNKAFIKEQKAAIELLENRTEIEPLRETFQAFCTEMGWKYPGYPSNSESEEEP